ncbi:MAG: hypothetical protein ACLQAH_04725 [Limisphaerales bacterium]
MNDLTARKRLIIAQADLHRQVIELECQRVVQRLDRTQDFVHQKRWWLLGGAAVGGLLLAPRWRRFLGWLPLIPDVLRVLRDE